MSLKILIADDHKVVRAGLASILAYEDDFEIVGEAANGQEAVTLACRLKPDVVVMDILMPVMDGIEATRRICAAEPSVRVLVLTTDGNPDDLRRALEAGAKGAVLKTVMDDELTARIRKVAAGGRSVSSEIKKLLKTEPPLPPFTERQLAILRLVVEGLSNEEIARRFDITVSGVKRHLHPVFEKLGATTRTEATALALKRGLV